MSEFDRLGEAVASGRTADVFLWGEGQVLKLYRAWVAFADVEAELRKTSAVHAAGLPVPAPCGIVRGAEQAGLVLERVIGRTMLEQLFADPALIAPLARQLADLHFMLHQKPGPRELPAQRDVLSGRISTCAHLSRGEKEAVLLALKALTQPGGDDRLCHGDFHPGNVMLTDRGPVVLDWVDACRGNPVADVARTSLLFLGHIEHAPVTDDEKSALALFHEAYLARYLDQVPGSQAEYQKWLPVMAAARLCEGIVEQQDWLLAQVRAGLSRG